VWRPCAIVEGLKNSLNNGWSGLRWPFQPLLPLLRLTHTHTYAKAALGDPYGLYNTNMAGASSGISRSGSGTVGDPYVYSAKGGDTETGAYVNVGNQATFARVANALFFIATENEWYKAAYYDPAKGGPGVPGYWTFPTMSDSAPGNDLIDPDPGNNATFRIPPSDYTIGSPYWVTGAGAHENSARVYGTFDQGGNVWEWNEAAIGSSRGLRGASWISSASDMAASFRVSGAPSLEGDSVGFRLSGPLEIPEPATLSLLGLGVAALLRRGRRRAQARCPPCCPTSRYARQPVGVRSLETAVGCRRAQPASRRALRGCAEQVHSGVEPPHSDRLTHALRGHCATAAGWPRGGHGPGRRGAW